MGVVFKSILYFYDVFKYIKLLPIGHFSIGFKGEGVNGWGLSYCILHYKGRLSKEKKEKKEKN